MWYICEIYGEYIGSAIYGSETVRMLKMPLAAMLNGDAPVVLAATVVFLVLPLMLYLLFSDTLREEMGSMVVK